MSRATTITCDRCGVVVTATTRGPVRGGGYVESMGPTLFGLVLSSDYAMSVSYSWDLCRTCGGEAERLLVGWVEMDPAGQENDGGTDG